AVKKDQSSSPKIMFKGGDGSTLEKAVIILGAKNSFQGVFTETLWIKRYYPGWKKNRQKLLSHNGKKYDCIEYINEQNEVKVIYFDITDFFGKF
ncbi:hypothetical protein ACFL2K_05150, partial [Candidatus Margulisiibacteriota bacterium]